MHQGTMTGFMQAPSKETCFEASAAQAGGADYGTDASTRLQATVLARTLLPHIQ